MTRKNKKKGKKGKRQRRQDATKACIDESVNVQAGKSGLTRDEYLADPSNVMEGAKQNIMASMAKLAGMEEELQNSVTDTSIYPAMFREARGTFEETLCHPTKSDEVWYVDYLESDGGHDTFERKCHVWLVEKEKCNDKIWPDGNGLSFTLSTAVEGGKDYWHDSGRLPLMINALISASNSPGADMFFGPPTLPPRRPGLLLCANSAIAKSLKNNLVPDFVEKIRSADARLVASARGGMIKKRQLQQTSNLKMPDELNLADMMRDMGHNLKEVASKETTRKKMEKTTLRGYDDPIPVKLSRRDHRDLVIKGGLPAHWFVEKPPKDHYNWRPTQLWGWRTLLENAAKRNDLKMTNNIIMKKPFEDVREFLNMRLMLNKIASNGMVAMCALLIKKGGALVDGVRDSENDPKWRKCQEQAGDSDAHKVHDAVRECHGGCVKLLLALGANPNYKNGLDFAPIHIAIAHNPPKKKILGMLLSSNKLDINQRDSVGMTALEIAKVCASNNPAYDVFPEMVQMIEKGKTGSLICARCGIDDGLLQKGMLRCTCRVFYCSKKCQRDHWREHKQLHKELMKIEDDKTENKENTCNIEALFRLSKTCSVQRQSDKTYTSSNKKDNDDIDSDG